MHEVLLRAAEGAELITGAEVSSVSPGSAEGDLATVTYRSGTGERVIESDLAVAADGVRSAVRALLFPDARSRYSGSTSWRAVIAGTDLDDHLVQAWGPGTEFGALPISGTEVYWYGYFRHPEGVV